MAEYIENVAAQTSKLDWAFPFERKGQFPLDRSAVFSSLADATKYASGEGTDERKLGGTSYVGQIISVYEAGAEGSAATVNAYIITPARSLMKLAATTASGDIASDVVELQGKVNTITSDLDTLEAAVANMYTNDQIDALIEGAKDDRVDALIETVGKAAEGENDATGLFKAIADEIARATEAEENLAGRIDNIDFVDEDELNAAIKNFATTEYVDGKFNAVEHPVLGVAENDKILALGADKLISATVSMSYDEINKAIKLYGKDNVELGSVDATPFIKDSMLDNVEYDAESNTLTFTWNTDSGKTTDTVVLSNIIEPYTAGDGLKLESNKFSVKLADGSESFLTVSNAGLKLSGIQTAIDTAAGIAKSEAIADAEGKIATAKEEAIDAAAEDATTKANTAEQNAKDYADGKFETKENVTKLSQDVETRISGVESAVAETYATKEELTPVITTANNASTKVNQLEDRLNDLVAEGGEPNTINTIKKNGVILDIAEDKSVDISVPTKFSDLTDDSGFGNRLTAVEGVAANAKTAAENAQVTANEAKADAEINATNISNLNTTVSGHTTTIDEHTTKINDLEAADTAHAAEFASLKQTVQGHTTEIAEKAAQIDLDAAVANITQNTTAITTLNETTIPAINEEVGKKANATNVYDKTAVEGLIETAKQEAIDEASYDDTQVKADIKANADAITALAALDETYATDDELAAAVEELEGKIGNITVPVTSVTGDERVISVVNTEGVHKVSATLGLKYTAATADANAKIELVGINDTVLGTIDASDFVKDGMLESVTKDETNNTITFTWNTDAGKQTTTIDIDDLVEVYTAGNGIDISNYSISTKVDGTSETFLTVGQNGIKLAGVQAAIDEAKQDAIDDADGKLAAAKAELEGKITAVDQDFVKEVQINGTALPATDKKVNIPVALANALGVVKGSADAVQTEGIWSGENKIMVAADGTMEVNKVNVNKLVQNEGDVLILNGGNALV